jgi:arabinose-5-phosphate isomerase
VEGREEEHEDRGRGQAPHRAGHRLTAAAVMHSGPRLVREDALAVDAAGLMEQHRITSVLVVDAAGVLVGALNTNDLMRAKVI